eukprot:15477082-Alexandrium_andersonii.AAC.1
MHGPYMLFSSWLNSHNIPGPSKYKPALPPKLTQKSCSTRIHQGDYTLTKHRCDVGVPDNPYVHRTGARHST